MQVSSHSLLRLSCWWSICVPCMVWSRVWSPMARCYSTSSLHWVSCHPSKLHWPCQVLPVWCYHSVWQWMRTCLSMSVPKKNCAQARVWRKHWPTVIQMPSLLSSTPTWHLSLRVSSCSTSVRVLSAASPLHWLSVFSAHSLQQYSWPVWFTNTSWVKTSCWTWHSPLLFQRRCWWTPTSTLWEPINVRLSLPELSFWYALFHSLPAD